MAQAANYRNLDASNSLGPTTNCPSCNNAAVYQITTCNGGLVYHVNNAEYPLTQGNVYQFAIGANGGGATYCGTINGISNNQPDAKITTGESISCSDNACFE